MGISAVRGLDRLIRSRTEKERRAAFGQMRGGVRALEIREKLVGVLAKLFMILDFGEHVEVKFDEARQDVSEVLLEIQRLIRAWEGAERAQRGLNIVLYGRPNSGKSSILNQLAHDDVAIVSSIPGTTRDSLNTEIQINGVRCRLTDTAGIRRGVDDVIEAEGIRRAQKRLEAADVILVVLDPETRDPEELLNDVKEMKSSESRVIIVKNKVDLRLPYPDLSSKSHVVYSFATSSKGCEELRKHLENTIEEMCPEANFLLDAEILRKCADSLTLALLCPEDAGIMCGYVETALFDCVELTDRGIPTESVLDGIFNKFCIGK
uniref:TrmE-type G domain-containing protein n=1 Tax=Caenorhabditis tropicalis TaxID=1561998 RepID=A0A1I7UZR0_9PELO